jgi:hypothetical protein
MELEGFGDYFFGRDIGHLEVVNLAFQFGQFRDELVQALLGWFVELREPRAAHTPVQVEPVRACHFVPDLLDFGPVRVQERFLGLSVDVRTLQMCLDTLRRDEE